MVDMESVLDDIIRENSLEELTVFSKTAKTFFVESLKQLIQNKFEVLKFKGQNLNSSPYDEFDTKLLVVVSNTNELEKYLFRKEILPLIDKRLQKLSLSFDDKTLVYDVRSTIDQVMEIAKDLFKEDVPRLTETEFSDIYKATCFTQDMDDIKVDKTLYEEFRHRKQFYITKYKYLMPTILAEVQKELSELKF
jgi:hypothetical protein